MVERASFGYINFIDKERNVSVKTADGNTPQRGIFRRIIRWVPAVILGVLILGVWTGFFVDGLVGVVAWLILLTGLPILGGLVLIVTGIYAALKRRMSPPIVVVLVLAIFSLWTGAWSFGLWQMPYPADLASIEPSATVRLPSDEQLLVVWGGDRLETNYHAFSPDQRWAYDLVVEPALNGSSNLEDYGCWETPVLAPVGARVHHIHDGEADETPGEASNNIAQPLGNFVVLEMPDESYLLLAHLKSGSVAVSEGDHVEEGEPLGQCGNSGNTSEPHIHIHHQRQDPKEYPVNFAEGLPLFFRDHDGDEMPVGGIDEGKDGEIIPLGDTIQHKSARIDS